MKDLPYHRHPHEAARVLLLQKLLITIAVFLGTIAVLLYFAFRTTGFFQCGGIVGELGIQYAGVWQINRDGKGLQHVLIFPRFSRGGYFGNGGNGNKPSATGIEVFGDGIFIDGVKIPTDLYRRVFVLCENRSVHLVLLTDAELALMTPEWFLTCSSSELWQDKIGPIVKSKEWSH